MLVSVLCPDLSQNCLGRAYVLAKLISTEYDVEVVGPMYKDEIWEPLKDEYEYKSIRTSYRTYRFGLSVREILHQIDGDIIYASKPRMGSFGVSLLSNLLDEKPIILDIDDWETGFKRNKSGAMFHIRKIPHLINVNSYYYTRALEAISSKADAITVSNSFLQSKFGGECIPHLRDRSRFNPSDYDSMKLREEFGLPERDELVLFFGTPHPYKGVEDLIEAVDELNREGVKALIVGVGSGEYSSHLQDKYGDSAIFRGRQPFEKIPEWTATADIVAIPQRSTPATQGQLPAKLFDAMAMGKPIVATSVSDIPKILENCGSVADPSSPNDFSEEIENLLINPDLREELGNNARDRYLKKYSYESRRQQVGKIIDTVTYE